MTLRKSATIEDIKRAAIGRWKEIIPIFSDIPTDTLTEKQPCPKCGGKDRFSVYKDFEQTGGGICRICKSGGRDGLKLIEHFSNKSRAAIFKEVARYLGLSFGKSDVRRPDENLNFLDWNQSEIDMYCFRKKGIKPEAIKKLGGRLAVYKENYRVIALPIRNNKGVCGWAVFRTDCKTLPLKRKNPDGSWSQDELKIQTTYGSQKGIIGEIDNASKTVWKTEGPTDLLSLLSQDLPDDVSAFCNAGGAQELPNHFEWLSGDLSGKTLFVVHDADKPGQQGALYVDSKNGPRPGWCPYLAAICGESTSVFNVELPYSIEESKGKDLRDFFQEGKTYNEIAFIASRSKKILAAESMSDPINEDETDPHRLGRLNIQSYKNEHNGVLYYYRQEWHKYKDGRYRRIEPDEFRAKITGFIRKQFEIDYREKLAEKNEEPPKIKKVTRDIVLNTIDALKSTQCISSDIPLPSWLPTREQKNYLSFKNGILDFDKLFAGDEDCFFDHTPKWFSTVKLDFDLDLSAKCPNWQRYLKFVCDGDLSKHNILQEWAGYLLWPKSDRQKFLVLEGEGGTGKSTYLSAMEALLGSQNISSVSLEGYADKNAMHSMLGKSANIAGDVGRIKDNEEVVLKRLTGGNPVNVERKYLTSISARVETKQLLAWNERPRFRDKSKGLWRRMLLIVFDREIKKEDRNKDMVDPDFWAPEVSGIAAWAIAGLKRLIENNDFTKCEETEEAIDDFRHQANPIMTFFDENIVFQKGTQAAFQDIYDAYKKWCEGQNTRPLSNVYFGKEFKRWSKQESPYPDHPREERTRCGSQRKRVFFDIFLKISQEF